MQQTIFIYTALPCEAKPLIEHFRLKKDLRVQAFAIYTRDNICLTVTGIGKSAMAAGVAYSQAWLPNTANPIMLNVGIAGHKHHAVGGVFLLNKITDTDSQKSFYPPIVFKPVCQVGAIQTSARPQLAYLHEELCDMEASAFYETAVRFSTGELVQTIKVISDNQDNSVTQITAPAVSVLLANHLDTIVKVLGQVEQLAQMLRMSEPEGFRELLSRYRFSVNEQQQLKTKLARWQLISHQDAFADANGIESGKAVLQWLDKKIAETDFYL